MDSILKFWFILSHINSFIDVSTHLFIYPFKNVLILTDEIWRQEQSFENEQSSEIFVMSL